MWCASCRIALIETSIPANVLARPSKEAPKDAKLVLTAPGMEKLEVWHNHDIEFVTLNASASTLS